jgi:hypothetical protein
MKTPAAADAVAAEPIPAGERADGALVDGAELETAGRLDALDAERDPAAEGPPVGECAACVPRRRCRTRALKYEAPAQAGVSCSAPERTRTSDLRFRRPTLYPTELRALGHCDCAV